MNNNKKLNIHTTQPLKSRTDNTSSSNDQIFSRVLVAINSVLDAQNWKTALISTLSAQGTAIVLFIASFLVKGNLFSNVLCGGADVPGASNLPPAARARGGGRFCVIW